MDKSIATYQKATGRNVKVSIDGEYSLPSEIAGGIELLAKNGRIKVENTLDNRLTTMSQLMLPELREILFGANPTRKFRD
jgi:V-type H+-transporting ATPase subunit E